jgi:multiple sugar transport system substrate-binding protein
VQVRFYALSGDLPAHMEAWKDTTLTRDATILAFRDQLLNVVPTPKIPEWEQITARVKDRAELAIRGGATAEQALALLDQDVAGILEKRRWLLEHRQHAGRRGPS